MNKQEAIQQSLDVIEHSAICILSTISEDGFPHAKAMLNLKHEGMKTIWFSTNTSSRRVQQLRNNNRACVYYVDQENFKGVMLVGTVEILQDMASRKLLWIDGSEMYYPLGIEDPDYSVLRFTAEHGNYYHNLENVSFDIE